uniref:Uncharacterized protein n=1 Tax=Vespula pensylvanica TaxID=30213 RepID=A0A834PA78_VESPE|nr:hypothetical protein H0235_002503 [Vespula pensylvanica]
MCVRERSTGRIGDSVSGSTERSRGKIAAPVPDEFRYACEEATEVETHHQQTAATTMGVAEDDTPSSLTSHPNLNTNNPGQEGLLGQVYVPMIIDVHEGQLSLLAYKFCWWKL